MRSIKVGKTYKILRISLGSMENISYLCSRFNNKTYFNMSHFAVMVIGDNVEEQLAPYDENIEVEPYFSREVSEKDKQWVVDYAKGTG